METQSSLFLAIDQGGHASRALIFDGCGQVVAQHHADIFTFEPRPGWVEHDPEELVSQTLAAISGAVAQLGVDRFRLKAAGLATQRSSMLCWNSNTGAALTPIISWADRRTADWLAAFNFDRADVLRRTGLVPNPHFGASKMRWCLDNVPSVQAAAASGDLCMGPLASYLLHRLLRERPLLVDPSNGSRTLLMDVHRSQWDAYLLDLFGVASEYLPTCCLSRHTFGTLVVEDIQVPLTVCTGDQAAALFCDGWPRSDTLYANAGTGAFIQRPVPALPIQQDNLLTSVVWRDKVQTLWVREGTVNGAGRALTWLNEREGRLADFSDFDKGATHPPLFLNSVGGLGSPFWRTDVAPRISEESADYPNKLAAVIESIVFLLVHNAECMEADAKPERLLVGGGMANSTRFCQSLADLLQLTVLRSRQTEATAAGLAFLTAEGLDDWRVAPSEVFTARENLALTARYRAWLTWIYAVIDRESC